MNKLNLAVRHFIATRNDPHTCDFVRKPASHKTLSNIMDWVGRKFGMVSWVKD